MALSKKQIASIEGVLRTSLLNKLKKHNPEPASMPFHTRLLGKDRLALYSFIHSLNTSFGTSIFEPIALTLSKEKYQNASIQMVVGNEISRGAQEEIQKIINGLTTARASPDKKKEVERIRRVCRTGKLDEVKPTKVDLMCRSKSGEYFLYDIKTAKPNAGSFREYKRTLLEWVATLLAKEPKAVVNTAIAIPYNPYEPEPYSRWTIRGMLDLKDELKVADQFWDDLGGKGAYKTLLGCFERVGIELRDDIDRYFKQRFR